MNAMMARDYAFYQAQFAALQASENEFDDALASHPDYPALFLPTTLLALGVVGSF